MNLKLEKSKKYYISRIIVGILLLLGAIFLLRVTIWEHNYYIDKEGSERAHAPIVGDVNVNPTSPEEEVTDEVITEEQVREYIVAPDMPRYLSIPKLGINKARIVERGTLSNGQMGTPKNNYDVAWWTGSNKPGTGGTSILNGHNGANTYGVFKQLPKLSSGDIITIELGNGTILNYRVYDNFTVSLEDASKKMGMLAISPVDDTESISLITCTGEWSYNEQTFLSRQFLRATLDSRTDA